MSAISIAGSSAYNVLASLVDGTTSANATVPAGKSPEADSAAPSSNNPTDVVDLSDHAKAVLARAKYEKAVADKLQAELDALKSKGANTSDNTKQVSSGNKQTSFDDLAKIAAPDDQSAHQALSDVTPTVNFSSALEFDGFTISAKGDGDTWSSDIEIVGPNGFSYTEKTFGAGKGVYARDHWGSGNYSDSESIYSVRKEDNKEYITITSGSAAAAAIETDDVSESAAAAQLKSTTFVVDFDTGSISVSQTDVSEVEASVALKQANS